MSDKAYWPPGPTRVEVEDCLLTHSLVLSEIYRKELDATDSPEVRFLLSALGQMVARQQAVPMAGRS